MDTHKYMQEISFANNYTTSLLSGVVEVYANLCIWVYLCMCAHLGILVTLSWKSPLLIIIDSCFLNICIIFHMHDVNDSLHVTISNII